MSYNCDKKICANCTHLKFKEHGYRRVYWDYEDKPQVDVFGYDAYCDIDKYDSQRYGHETCKVYDSFSICSESNKLLTEKARRDADKARIEAEREKQINDRLDYERKQAEKEKERYERQQNELRNSRDYSQNRSTYHTSSSDSKPTFTIRDMSKKGKIILFTLFGISVVIIIIFLAVMFSTANNSSSSSRSSSKSSSSTNSTTTTTNRLAEGKYYSYYVFGHDYNISTKSYVTMYDGECYVFLRVYNEETSSYDNYEYTYYYTGVYEKDVVFQNDNIIYNYSSSGDSTIQLKYKTVKVYFKK